MFLSALLLFFAQPSGDGADLDLHGQPLAEGGKWVNLRPLGTERAIFDIRRHGTRIMHKPYSLIQVAIPFGVGARFRINEVMDIWADLGFRYTFTDYLDDVSRNYVNLYHLKKSVGRGHVLSDE